MNRQISKIVNYIWLSGERQSDLIQKCRSSWNKFLNDYEICKWDMQSFIDAAEELNVENPLELKYVKGAIEQKKWAFASDYLRQWILYYKGGIYLDADVQLQNSAEGFFNTNLNEQFVSCMEIHKNVEHLWKDLIEKDGTPKSEKFVPGICIQAAFLMGQKGNAFSGICLDYYKDKEFIMYHDDGATNMYLAPDIYAYCARPYGFKYADKLQVLNNNIAKIYSSDCISSSNDQMKECNIGFHLCAHSWDDVDNKFVKLAKLARELWR